MLKNLNIEDKKLETFLNHCAEQFIILAQKSFIKPEEAKRAEMILRGFLHNANYSLDSFVRRSKEFGIDIRFSKAIAQAKSFDDKILEPVKKTIFHEFIHIMQINFDGTKHGYSDAETGYGLCMNEVAAEIGEEVIWRDYLKTVKKIETADLVSIRGSRGIPGGRIYDGIVAIESREKPIPGPNIYFRETSLGVNLIVLLGIRAAELVRGSTVFGSNIREKIPSKFQRITGNRFDKFLKAMDTMYLCNHRGVDCIDGKLVHGINEYEKALAMLKPKEQLAEI